MESGGQASSDVEKFLDISAARLMGDEEDSTSGMLRELEKAKSKERREVDIVAVT